MLPLWLFSLLWWSSILVVTASICSKDERMELYHNYNNTDCPPTFVLDDDHCQATDWRNPLHLDVDPLDQYKFVRRFGGFCDSFCQLKTEYTWGQEQPIDTQKLCRGPDTCRLTPAEIVGIDWPQKYPNAPAGWHAEILEIGISNGYFVNSGDSYPLSKVLSIEIGQGECGYWTFIPYIKQTCGTYTRRDTLYYRFDYAGGPAIEGCDGNERSSPNVCVHQPVWYNIAPRWDGERVDPPRQFRGLYKFVRVDCYTGQKLASALNDNQFRHPGVALKDDSPYWTALTEHWKYMEDLPNWRPNGDPNCLYNQRRDTSAALASVPHPSDCIDAMNSLRKEGDARFSSLDVSNIANYGQCYIWVELQAHAPIPKCQYTYLEVAIAM